MRHALLALGLLLSTTSSHAADVSLGLSNKAIAADFTSQPIGQGLDMTGGWLHDKDKGDVGSVGLQVSQGFGGGGEGRLGGKLYFVRNDIRNATALALGGQFEVPVASGSPVMLGAHAWYAPSITTFNRSKSLYDIGATVSLRALNNADVFVTLRRVRIDYKTEGGKTLFSGPLLGMRLFF